MAATMKFVTSYAGFAERAGVVRASASVKSRRDTDAGSRPHQKALDVNDLTQQERDELAGLLEAEIARL